MTTAQLEQAAPRRAHKRQRLSPETRRDALFQAALQEFAELPYDAASMAAIAKRVGASEALVYRYFGTKAALYALVVQDAIRSLASRQEAALAALPSGATGIERLGATTHAYLDHIATHPVGWAAPQRRSGLEPKEALTVRDAARVDYATRLASEVGNAGAPATRYAVAGYFGFLESACLEWVDAGCPEREKTTLVAAAIGSLLGALGADDGAGW